MTLYVMTTLVELLIRGSKSTLQFTISIHTAKTAGKEHRKYTGHGQVRVPNAVNDWSDVAMQQPLGRPDAVLHNVRGSVQRVV